MFRRLLSAIRFIANGELLKVGFRLASWRIATLTVSTLATIWAVRCLGPSPLGIAALVIAGIQQCVAFGSLIPNGYAIRKLKECDSEADQTALIRTTFVVRFWITFIIAAIVMILVATNSTSRAWLGVAAIGVPIAIALVCNLSWVLQAREQQVAQYRSEFAEALISLILIAVIFRPGVTASVYVSVKAFSACVSFFIVLRAVRLKVLSDLLAFPTINDVSNHIKRGFAIYSTGALVLVYGSLEVPLVGLLCSVEELGVYRSAHTLNNALRALLGLIPILLYPRFLEWKKQGNRVLWERQLRLAASFCAVGIPILMIVFYTSPQVFEVLFGVQFAGAALPFSFLVASRFVVLLNGIYAYGLWALGKDRQVFVAMSGAAVASLILNVYFIPILGMLAAAITNVISECIVLLFTLFTSRRNLSK